MLFNIGIPIQRSYHTALINKCVGEKSMELPEKLISNIAVLDSLDVDLMSLSLMAKP